MERNERARAGTGWAPAAVTDQLAYDVALVTLAVEHGIEVELGGFERPQLGRIRLEQALKVQGVLTDHVGDRPAAPPWS